MSSPACSQTLRPKSVRMAQGGYVCHKEYGFGQIQAYTTEYVLARFAAGQKRVPRRETQPINVIKETQSVPFENPTSITDYSVPPEVRVRWTRYSFQKPNTTFWNRYR